MEILGVGIDIENVDRFKVRLVQNDMRFFERLFSKQEMTYCMDKKYPDQHFAARFCAKEAFIKAASSIESFKLTDIQLNKIKDMPCLEPWESSAAVERVQKFFKKYNVLVSVSHTAKYACAQVMVIKNKREEYDHA